MTTFSLRDLTSDTSALAELLTRNGATSAPDGELIIISVSSLAEALERLAAMAEGERARCVVMGLNASLEAAMPAPSVASLLDELQPLGLLDISSDPLVFDFIGRKSMSQALNTPYGKMSSSHGYAGYMTFKREDAGAFVLRYFLCAAGASE